MSSRGNRWSGRLRTGIGFGSLVHRARQANPGWVKPSDRFEVGKWFQSEPLFGVDADAIGAPPLRIIDPTQYQGLPIPPRRWLIRDWAPWGYVTGLYGEGGLGKSLVAQQLQTAAAVGRSWLGLETAPMRSLGFYCEDSAEELWRRQADIDRLYGCDFKDLEAARWMSRLGDENLLIKFSARTGAGELTSLHGQVIEAARDHRAELVIIDTVSDTFGGNENDRGQVRAYVSWCLGTIAREIGGSVLCLAHPSRAGIASGSGDGGSTGWSAAFRSRLSLQMPTPEKGDLPDPDARVLSRKKANYAAREDVVKLRWSAGALVVAAPAEADRHPARPCADVFLALLDDANKAGRNVAESSRAANYAPKLFAMHPACDGWKPADFQRAMERLFAVGAIRVEAYGRKGDQRQRVVRTAAEPAEVAA